MVAGRGQPRGKVPAHCPPKRMGAHWYHRPVWRRWVGHGWSASRSRPDGRPHKTPGSLPRRRAFALSWALSPHLLARHILEARHMLHRERNYDAGASGRFCPARARSLLGDFCRCIDDDGRQRDYVSGGCARTARRVYQRWPRFTDLLPADVPRRS